MDYALNMKVLEYCNHPDFMTDNTTWQYNGKTGYLGVHTPAYITTDLQEIRSIRQICFKIWDFEDKDNLDPGKAEKTNQVYTYRLLVSDDMRTWRVLFDCADMDGEKYLKGWQDFIWDSPVMARYIRIHGIHGKRNSGFHIVKLHARDNAIPIENPGLIMHFNTESTYETEIGDAYPLSYQLNDFSGRIQETLGPHIEHNYKAKQIYDSIVDYLFRKAKEVDVVNGKVDEIRRLIADPVKEQFEERFRDENKSNISNNIFQVVQLLMWLGLLLFSIFYNG